MVWSLIIIILFNPITGYVIKQEQNKEPGVHE